MHCTPPKVLLASSIQLQRSICVLFFITLQLESSIMHKKILYSLVYFYFLASVCTDTIVPRGRMTYFLPLPSVLLSHLSLLALSLSSCN